MTGLETKRQEKKSQSIDDEFASDMEKLFSMFKSAKQGMMQREIVQIGENI